MSVWDTYPANYRQREIQALTNATKAGECASLVGLSGSGKSNLTGFLAHRLGSDGHLPGVADPHPRYVMVDCNRLSASTPQSFFDLVLRSLESAAIQIPPDTANSAAASFSRLDQSLRALLHHGQGVCLLLDRFDSLLSSDVPDGTVTAINSNLRALRDTYKYGLTYITATRRPLELHSELAELFYAHTIWLGPLDESDTRWNVQRFTDRKGLAWDEKTVQHILQFSRGYPSMVRAVCEAHAAGCALERTSLLEHLAVQRRVSEFWADKPSQDDLVSSGLEGHPLLTAERPLAVFDTGQLTAKENLLWVYFQEHPDEVCEKDDLIQAVWPENHIYERGVRDDSLAQLVRRLREKVEQQPSYPKYIHTVIGRGYRFTPE